MEEDWRNEKESQWGEDPEEEERRQSGQGKA